MLRQDLIGELIRKNLPLAAAIRTANSISSSSDSAYSFIISCLRFFYPKITDKQLGQDVTDQDRDASMDAVHFDDTTKSISIFDFKIGKDFEYKEVKQFSRDLDQYIFSPNQSLTGLAKMVVEKITKIKKLVRKGWSIKLYIVRGGSNTPRQATTKILEELKSAYSCIDAIEFLNPNQIIERYLAIIKNRNSSIWKIKIVSDSKNSQVLIKDKHGKPISLVARIKLSDIAMLQKDFKGRGLDLFDLNVREFQKNKPLSTKILQTIRHNAKDFYIFHNGITFTCESIRVLLGGDFEIKMPQIINGCQTVNTIYEAFKNDLRNKNLMQATVLCRFYALPGNMVEKVCEAANTQVKIDPWDLRSNDDIQKIFQVAMSAKNIDYVRKEVGSKKDNRVFMTELAQWLHSCKNGKPAEAKNKKAQLFDVLPQAPIYKNIFNESLTLEELASISEIGIFVRGRIKQIPKSKRLFEKDADLHIAAGIYLLRDRKWPLPTKFKKVNTIINVIARSMMKNNLSVNQIFSKSDAMWEKLKTALAAL